MQHCSTAGENAGTLSLSLFLLQEHDCTLTREIVELVDREADLLVRGMKEHTLQGTILYFL